MSTRIRGGVGGRLTSIAQTQWAPTLTFHDPNPPITIEGSSAAVEGTLAGQISAQAALDGAIGESGNISAQAIGLAAISGALGASGTVSAQAVVQGAISGLHGYSGALAGQIAALADFAGTFEAPVVSGTLDAVAVVEMSAAGQFGAVSSGGGTRRRRIVYGRPVQRPRQIEGNLDIALRPRAVMSGEVGVAGSARAGIAAAATASGKGYIVAAVAASASVRMATAGEFDWERLDEEEFLMLLEAA